jgi:hypothetical protein
MRIGRRLGIALATATFGVLMLFVAPATEAEATPAAPTHGSYQNGCTLSPDSGYAPVYFNFHNACDWHDLCYHYHWYSRKGCDDGFHSRMRSWCASYHSNWAARYNCYAVAGTYYSAVRAAGWAFY